MNRPCRPLYHPAISYSNVERQRLVLVKGQSHEESTHCFSEEEEEKVPAPVGLPTTRGPPIFENTFKVRYHYYCKLLGTLALQKLSVADPGCLSRIPYPDFYPSRISDPGFRIQKQQQKRGVKKICCHIFFCSHKFHKLNIILFL